MHNGCRLERRHRPGPSPQDRNEQLVPGARLATGGLDNATRSPLPAAFAQPTLQFGGADTGGAGLTHAEDPVGDGVLRVGFDHPATLARRRPDGRGCC